MAETARLTKVIEQAERAGRELREAIAELGDESQSPALFRMLRDAAVSRFRIGLAGEKPGPTPEFPGVEPPKPRQRRRRKPEGD